MKKEKPVDYLVKMLHTAFEVMKIGEYQIKPILQGDKDYTLEEDEKLAVSLGKNQTVGRI